MGGCADEADGAAFDPWEEDILLGFAEAVDFVDEERGAAVVETAHGFGGFDGLADVGDIGFDAAEVDEAGLGGAGDELGETGFAGAWWSVEEEGGKAVGFDGAAEEFAGAENVLLAGVFVERARAHASGEGDGAEVGGELGWCGGATVRVVGVVAEEFVHGEGRWGAGCGGQ